MNNLHAENKPQSGGKYPQIELEVVNTLPYISMNEQITKVTNSKRSPVQHYRIPIESKTSPEPECVDYEEVNNCLPDQYADMKKAIIVELKKLPLTLVVAILSCVVGLIWFVAGCLSGMLTAPRPRRHKPVRYNSDTYFEPVKMKKRSVSRKSRSDKSVNIHVEGDLIVNGDVNITINNK